MPMTAPQFHGCAVLNTYDPGRRRIYELIVRQEPKQARMCGVGGKADRRPIDPPPIVQLRVIDPALQQGSSGSRHRRTSGSVSSPPGSPRGHHDDAMAVDAGNCTQNYLQNPYYFMFASLARPDDDNELHWLKDGRTRCTTGSVVSSLYHLKDPQHNNEDAGFFVFPDLSVRTEGSYRLKLSLFEVVNNNVHHCKSIYSAPFYVYTAKKFPGMEESTPLSCSLADQGIKIRIRKDIRVRKKLIPSLTQPLSQSTPINSMGRHGGTSGLMNVDGNDSDDENDPEDDDDSATIGSKPKIKRRESKRSRLDDGSPSGHGGGDAMDVSNTTTPGVGPAPGLAPVPQHQPHLHHYQPHPHPVWPPPTSLNPNLGPNIPPPPGAISAAGPVPATATPSAENGSMPGPSVFDGRGGGFMPYDPQQQQQQQLPPPSQYRDPSGAPVSLVPPQQPQQPAHPQQHAQYQPHPPPPQQQQQQGMPPPHPPQQPMAPPPLSMAPPPPPPHHQGYVPYAQWGAPMSMPPPPQPQQQPVYDYYHHHQQPQQHMQPPYAYPQQQPQQQQPMHGHPPPPHQQQQRYDYSGSMYAPPPPAPQYGYYDPQQQGVPPPPHHQMTPGVPPPPPPPGHAPSLQAQGQPQQMAPPPPPQYATPAPIPPPGHQQHQQQQQQQQQSPTQPGTATNSPSTVPPPLAPSSSAPSVPPGATTSSAPVTPGYDYYNTNRAPTGSPQPRGPAQVQAQAPVPYGHQQQPQQPQQQQPQPQPHYAQQGYVLQPPPPPPMHPQARPNPYGQPPHPPTPYAYPPYGAPPAMNPNTNIPHSQEWGTPPAFAHGAAANHWGAPDANGYVQQQVHQPQQQQQQYYYPHQQYQQPQQYAQYPGPHQQYPHQPMQHVSPSVPSSAPSSAMPTSASPSVAGSGPTTSSGDRVHLPPLRGAHGSPVLANQTTSSPDVNVSGSSGVVAAQTAPAVIQLRSSSRGDYTNGSGAPAGGHRQSDSTGSAGGRERDMDRDELENREWERERDQRERERERERDQRDMRERERARDGTQGGGRERDGKKNPLNIRSIISAEDER